MSEAIANLLVRGRWPLLALAAVLTVASIVPAGRLKLDRSIESLYAPDDPILLDYRKSKNLFGGDEFVIIAWQEPNLLDEDGKLTETAIPHIRELSNELSRVGGVNRASTQDLAGVVASAVRFAQETAAERFGGGRLLRGIAGRYALERQQDAIEFSRGILVSEDGKTTSIVLRLRPENDAPIPRDQTIRRIRERAADFAKRWNRPIYVAGEPVQVFDAFEYVEDDGRTLFVASLLLLGGVLLLLFRSLRWVLLPLAVTGASVLWTLAALQVWGAELSMVSSMLNSLVTIVAVATVTHAAVTYREWRRRLGRLDALRRSIAELSIPIFWNILTTVAGFESLVTSDVQPVRSFGIMTALGTGLVLVATALIVPGGAVLGAGARERKHVPDDVEHRHPRVSTALLRTTAFARRHAAAISIVSLILAAVSVVGMTRMDVETDFSRNFRADSPIVRSLDFIERNLGGAGSWEVNFPAPHTLTPEYLDRVRALAKDLRELKIGDTRPLTKVIAITDGLDLLPRNLRTGDIGKDLAQIGRLQPEFAPSLYNAEQGRMRIVLRSWERRQAEEKRVVIDAVRAVAAERFPEPAGKPEATGLFVLLTYVIESLMQSQYVSFGLAAGAIFVMMLFAFRRILLSFVALLPSALPIAMLLGGMGVFGIPVNIGTAMIASVSIGLTIDSSIHYLIAYREARDRGRSVQEALDATSGHVGVALVFSTLALSAGFCVLTLSHFVPMIYFGVLVSLAMAGGLFGNLLLLPALVPWVDRDARTPAPPKLEPQPAT